MQMHRQIENPEEIMVYLEKAKKYFTNSITSLDFPTFDEWYDFVVAYLIGSEIVMKEKYDKKMNEAKIQLRSMKDYAPKKPTIASSRKHKLAYLKHQQNYLKKRNEMKEMEAEYQKNMKRFEQFKEMKIEIDEGLRQLNEWKKNNNY